MWLERSGFKNRGHRPDLIGFLTDISIPFVLGLAARSRRGLDTIKAQTSAAPKRLDSLAPGQAHDPLAGIVPVRNSAVHS